jgi:hypothetical protein
MSTTVTRTTVATKDAASDQLKLLLLLAADWLNGDRTHARDIAELVVALTPVTAPPGNVDVPYAEQRGGQLTCTMGNWSNAPTSYAYQWKRGATNIGGNSSTYAVTSADVGTTVTCVVTATNALGSTVAPPSNAVLVV